MFFVGDCRPEDVQEQAIFAARKASCPEVQLNTGTSRISGIVGDFPGRRRTWTLKGGVVKL